MKRCQGPKTGPLCAAFLSDWPAGVSVIIALTCQTTNKSYVLTGCDGPGTGSVCVVGPVNSFFSALTASQYCWSAVLLVKMFGRVTAMEPLLFRFAAARRFGLRLGGFCGCPLWRHSLHPRHSLHS